jgi:NAD(P)-dependent dehydrogenase (short-subunit alcohol dehydrogenase family)
MLLQDKIAIIYGAGGSIGAAVAAGFAGEGARVFIAGRTKAKLDKVADRIRNQGGAVESAIVDALDEAQVDAYVDGIAKQAGKVDISFNVIGLGDVQKPLTEISLADFLQPIDIAMRTQFLTTRAAARHMRPRKSGVILSFGGSGPQTMVGLGGFKIALDAMEGLRRQWAIELGEQGIRVLTIKTGGITDSIPDYMPGKSAIVEGILADSMLGRTATLSDVANIACFLASDKSRTLTSTWVNISCGAIVD